jgi:hypothetical protein
VFDAIIGNAVRLCGAVCGIVWRYEGDLTAFVSAHNLQPEELEPPRYRSSVISPSACSGQNRPSQITSSLPLLEYLALATFGEAFPARRVVLLGVATDAHPGSSIFSRPCQARAHV